MSLHGLDILSMWMLFFSLLCATASAFHHSPRLATCEGVDDVVGVEAPLGGVAQVIFHGVQVVEVSLQVREHQDRGEEEDGDEGQVEVERERGRRESKTTTHVHGVEME